MASQVRVATEADLPRVVELLAQLSIDEPREQSGSLLPDVYTEPFGACRPIRSSACSF